MTKPTDLKYRSCNRGAREKRPCLQAGRRICKSIKEQFVLVGHDKLGMIGIIILLSFCLIAIMAPYIAPHDPMETLTNPDGTVVRMEPPSWKHPFGTSRMGRDILSQVIVGSRVGVSVGLLCAVMVVFIGTNIGIIAGYYGGKIDEILMRFTDIVYGIPFLPFAIILVALLGPGISNIILAIVLIAWRSTARVIRAQVLTIKQRAFIEASRVTGASDLRIMYRHIAPNVLPLAFVYGALSMGWAVLTEASISFLGYGDPLLISWGKIIFMCYVAQAITVAWWWVLAPGLTIMLLVLSGFFIGRAYEQVVNPRLRER